MPLKKESAPATLSRNVRTLLHDYERKQGKIGTKNPKGTKKTRKTPLDHY